MLQVLLPVDTDVDRALAAASAVTSLPNAADTVRVTILNVTEKLEVSTEAGIVQSEDWYDETNIPEAVERARSHLEAAGVETDVRRAHADPAQKILEVADEIDADRIVMCGRKRSTVGKVLLGSVTQAVLLNAEMPVTVVHASS